MITDVTSGRIRSDVLTVMNVKIFKNKMWIPKIELQAFLLWAVHPRTSICSLGNFYKLRSNFSINAHISCAINDTTKPYVRVQLNLP